MSDVVIGNNKLMLGDCLERMKEIPDGSVDMILCDLPYQITGAKWDVVVDTVRLSAEYSRLIKKSGMICLTCNQPFTTVLMNNIKNFKYEIIWEKHKPVGHLNAKKRPMTAHETILVFCDGSGVYNPQGLIPSVKSVSRTSKRTYTGGDFDKTTLTQFTGYPRSVIKFPHDKNGTHPTQKPVALMEYLIKTYSNEGETVLDNTMGSGTTGVACTNTNRSFIGIEMDEGYYNIAKDRITASVSGILEAA